MSISKVNVLSYNKHTIGYKIESNITWIAVNDINKIIPDNMQINEKKLSKSLKILTLKDVFIALDVVFYMLQRFSTKQSAQEVQDLETYLFETFRIAKNNESIVTEVKNIIRFTDKAKKNLKTVKKQIRTKQDSLTDVNAILSQMQFNQETKRLMLKTEIEKKEIETSILKLKLKEDEHETTIDDLLNRAKHKKDKYTKEVNKAYDAIHCLGEHIKKHT